ncbi:hypothetical protein D3C76_1052740 [compost metagenome]
MLEKTIYEHYDPAFFPNLMHEFVKSEDTTWVVRGEADGSIDRIEMRDFLGWRLLTDITVTIKLDQPRFEAKFPKRYKTA